MGDVKQRAMDKLARLSLSGLDLVSLWREATPPLAAAVPHFHAPCWHTLDPASLLITSHFDEGIPEVPAEWLAAEYLEEDVNKLADVARTRRGVQTLHDVTGGDPSHTPRWQANIEMGGDQELIGAIRTRAGEVWGAIGLYREPGEPMFDRADLDFVRAVSPLLAEGTRRALLLAAADEAEWVDGPCIAVLGPGFEVESASHGVQRWFGDLAGSSDRERLPVAIRAVAARALAAVAGPVESATIVSRVRASSGTWVVLHGLVLDEGRDGRVAVVVEPTHPARISSLLMSAYGLSPRERDVVRAVLAGGSTAEIAAHLHLSAHTVQQHLKSIFDKTGVRSRRDLVGKVFFAHYEPRVRDNERRTTNGRPIRGEPLPT